ncbi:hypothetical protein [Helicobacter rodentium]|uniref:hypothetical protein n=1 Tax=Helicobacter rodentium TaxID=59617 RepID=UPI0025A65B76|nr:hypothetical protein [Helicobacter rodentium]
MQELQRDSWQSIMRDSRKHNNRILKYSKEIVKIYFLHNYRLLRCFAPCNDKAESTSMPLEFFALFLKQKNKGGF